ncbi:MAG: hypothetical protein ABGW98_01045, partial [Myxococcales bacterium]
TAPKEQIEGRSLAPLLEDPSRDWPWPSITTYGSGNHTARDERWRYIRYHDGSEELYDHESDPMEWTNLASAAQHVDVKQRLASALPRANAERIRGRTKPVVRALD